uniref:Uncharacterized protein n=1 Tax=Thermodesulfovibrio aggregans TaxID=86166 RepID=A0A7C4AJT6_9BACT
MLKEFKKYFLRFGVAFFGVIIFASFLGLEQVKIVLYKIGMVIVGITLAEITWIFFFKPVFGATEDILNNEKFKAVLIFRGILYAAIILALTLGL